MLTFAWYLLKVMLVSGILFSYYCIALRNKKFHLYNRFYLLAIIALSWLIPLLKINIWQDNQPQVVNLLTVVANGDLYVEKANQFKWDWQLTVILIMLLISALFLARFLTSLLRIRSIINKNPGKKWRDVYFVFTNEKGTPFSFLKYIFWNEQIDLNSAEGEQILKHELTHVYEKHSADKIFLSVALIVSWYNPFIWLIRKELYMIHEFIADQKAVSDGDVHSFAMMLLKAAYPQHSFSLANPFFYSPIKRRLLMLTTISNPRYSYIRRLMALPLLAILILFFAFRVKEKGINALYKQSGVSSVVNRETETPAQFPGGMVGWKRYLERNLNLNVLKDHKAPVGTYAPVIVFTVNTDGSISNVIAETKAGYGTEEEAIRLIKKGPKWEPAKKDGAFIEAKVKQTVNFVLTEGGALVYIDSLQLLKGANLNENSTSAVANDTTKKKNRQTKVMDVTFKDASGNQSTTSTPVTFTSVTITSKDTGKLTKPLVVLDGKEMKWDEFQLKDIKPEKIESINVLKNESATSTYGDKGKNGVIIITLKRQNSDQKNNDKDDQKNFEAQQKKFEAEKKEQKSFETQFDAQQKKFEAEKKEQKNFEAQQKKFEAGQKKSEADFEAERSKQEQQMKYSKVFTKVENPPYYPNGMSAFAEYINRNMQYPKEAIQNKVEGAVLIQFIVNEEGKLSDFKKLSDKGHGLEEEAIRLLKNSGVWKPGVQNGRPVTVQVQQQVIFQLPVKS